MYLCIINLELTMNKRNYLFLCLLCMAYQFSTAQAVDSMSLSKDKTTKQTKENNPSEAKTPKTKGTFTGIPTLYSNKPFRTWSIDAMVQLNNAQADIKHNDWWGPFKPINENRVGFSVGVTKMLSGAFGINTHYRYGSVAGFVDNTIRYSEDQIYMVRDLGIDLNRGAYFKSSYHQWNTVVVWDISNTAYGLNRLLNPMARNKPYKLRKVSLYSYAGLGLIWFKNELRFLDTKTEITQADLDLNSLDDTKYLVYPGKKTVTEVSVPTGVGLRFKCSKLIDVKIEGQSTFLFTDKLDGLVYDHPNRWKNDVIIGFTAGITFKLGCKKNDKESINWVNGFEYFNARFDKIERKLDKVLTDNDKDGVSDAFDKETETPEGVMVDGSGKSMDIDRDGIVDVKDLEVFSPDPNAVDEFGKTKDDDADGVVNAEDKEPNSARGAKVDWQGVTIPAPIVATTQSVPAFDKLILSSVYFDYNQSLIKPEYYKELFKVVNFAKQNPTTKIIISGNTDIRGGDTYNVKLGQDRAEAIMQYFAKNFNIPTSQFVIESKGKSEPISKSNELNRRVDFIITK